MRSASEDTQENYVPTDFSKMKVGIQTLNDAVIKLGQYRRINPKFGDKKNVLAAIDRGDIETQRLISNFFFRTSGIYNRLCRYMAYLYKYDWFVTPYISNCDGLIDASAGLNDVDSQVQTKTKKKQFANFFKILNYFENFEIKRYFGEVALKVIRNGCYYGYLITKPDRAYVQELHPAFCRSRFKVDQRPVVEFNMRYFEVFFPNPEQRKRVLKLFPEQFTKGYKLFEANKLIPMFPGDDYGWYILDTKKAIKFNINDEDFPMLISVIPAIIDLDAAQDLDKKRMAQKLLKIIIQRMPIDKNGDLVFDVDEAAQLHNNAVNMLSKAIGVDVLTTFAEVDVADMSERGNQTSTDELAKVERTVYNEAGVSQLQFNSDGNIALNNSILNDEASMYNLLVQFEAFLNVLLEPYNKSPKKVYYRAQLLTTTIYNYKELAKLYEGQAKMGYSKMLPQVALGQTQSSVLANAYFENDILDLVRVFIPPLTSNTMNAEALQNRGATSGKPQSGSGGNQNQDQEGAGRPEKADSEKSEKTIQNRQSM